MMILLTIAVVLFALYLAFKLLESALKVVVWGLVLAAIYWVSSSLLGWPPLPELIQQAWWEIEALIPWDWLQSLQDVLNVAASG